MNAPEAPDLVVARLLDYFGRRTDWQRRLWNPGTVNLLAETLEALAFLETGHLRERTVVDLSATAQRRAGPDLGVGPPAIRSALRSALRAAPGNTLGRYQLEHLLMTIRENYLGRWSDALSDEPGRIGTEEASRLLAGHLLGLGFSPESLHRWAVWFGKTKRASSLAELFDEAEQVARRPTHNWTVLIPFGSIERHEQTMPPEWLEPADVTVWLDENAPHASIRQAGGFVVDIEALDPWAAVEVASDAVESLAARVAVGMPGNARFHPLSEAFVAGSTHDFQLGRPRRQVDVHSLKRQNALFSIAEPSLRGRLRSAIDLVAPLETGAPGAAIAGGWAAIEAILARPDTQNVEAASDLAVLIACSFPRAELTPLTYAYERENDDALAAGLAEAPSNRVRCELLGRAIERGDQLSFEEPSDRAAAERLREIVGDPRVVLGRVTAYAEEAIRRLYRQRNLVLHAGITSSVAMAATLRTVPPLVGAGLDRLVHDALATGTSEPLRLVARARSELEICGQPGGSEIWDLLGH